MFPVILYDMEPEGDIQDIQERIEKLEGLTKENNKILRKLRNHMRVGAVMRLLYWCVIVGSMVGAYYYLQPFVQPLMDTYDTLIGIPDAVKNIDIPGNLGF